MEQLTHIDKKGRPKMVEVGHKEDTKRVAVARGSIFMKKNTLDKIKGGQIGKGDVLSVAQTAGIMAVKQTANLIPMCHNIFITGVEMDFEIDEMQSAIHIEACVNTIGKTGIEMEALHGVSVAALTIYDMCKAIDRGMVISDIKVMKKEGGKSGMYLRRNPKVLAINVSEKTGVIKKSIDKAEFLVDYGIKGDAHGGLDPIKQVSLLADESVDKLRGLGMELVPGAFAENITTEGIELHTLPLGTRFKVGTVLLEVSKIGKECHTGCAIKQLTGECIMPKEGIFTRVIESGIIQAGDAIEIIKP